MGKLTYTTLETQLILDDVINKIDKIEKGQISGVATLDSTGKVPLIQLPPLGSTVTASNGLTISNDNITLGGSLINDTKIDGLFDIEFNTSSISLNSQDITSYSAITYNADYSTNYTDRSIPDVEWVNSQIGNIDLSDYLPKTGGTISGSLTVNDNLQIGSASNLDANVVLSKDGNASFYIRNLYMDPTPFGTLPFGPAIDAQVSGMLTGASKFAGGLQLAGLTNDYSASLSPMVISGYHGVTAPTAGAVIINTWKTDGSTGRVALSDTEKLIDFHNGEVSKAYITGDGSITATNLSGINTGDQDLSSYVTGASSSTDNAIARFDSTTGKVIQDSLVTISDKGKISLTATELDTPLGVNSILSVTTNLTDGGGLATDVRSIRGEGSYYGTDHIYAMYGSRYYAYNKSTGIVDWLYGSTSLAANDGNGTATNVSGIYAQVRNAGTGIVNKMIGTWSNITNSSNNVANNDIYGSVNSLTNSGVFDQGYTIQNNLYNTGTINQFNGIQLNLIQQTGHINQVIGVEIGKEHNWDQTGTVDDSYGVFIDASTNIGTTQSYAIKSESTAPSEFAGTLTASNLSGTNTGDQDLSGYATITELDLKAMQNPGVCQRLPIKPADIVIDPVAKTFTIATVNNGQTISAANPIRVFTDGSGIINKWEKTTPQTVSFTKTNGVWYFHFDNTGNLVATQTPWSDFNLIAPIYRFYLNDQLADADMITVRAWEAHLNDISASDHAWKHAQGTIHESGFDIVCNQLTTGSPNADGRNTCISLTTGKNSDDGLEYTVTNTSIPVNAFEQNMGTPVSAVLSSSISGLFKIRINDSAGRLYFLPATNFPFAWDVTTNRPQYITELGTRILVTDNRWFVYYVYALQDDKVGEAIKLVSAEAEFTSLVNAQAHAWENLQALYATLNDKEIRPLYKLIFYNDNSGGGAFNVACKYSVLREYTDIRRQKVTSTAASAGSVLASNVVTIPGTNLVGTNADTKFTEVDNYITSHKPWTSSGHTGTALTTPSFGTSGQAIELDLSQDSADEVSLGKTSGQNLSIKSALDTPVSVSMSASNWTLTAGWEATNDSNTQLNHNAAGTTSATYLINAPSVYTTYKIDVTSLATVTGGFTFIYGNVSSAVINPTVGVLTTTTFYLKTYNSVNNIVITPVSTARFTISSITITPVLKGNLAVEDTLTVVGIKHPNVETAGIQMYPNGQVRMSGFLAVANGSSQGVCQANVILTNQGTATPTGTTASWLMSSNANFNLVLTSSTGNVVLTQTGSVSAGYFSILTVLGHGTADRLVTLSQTGMVWIYNGVSYTTSVVLDTILATKRNTYQIAWLSSSLAQITKLGSNDGTAITNTVNSIPATASGATYTLVNNSINVLTGTKLTSGNQIFTLPTNIVDGLSYEVEVEFEIGATLPTIAFSQTLEGTIPTWAINSKYQFVIIIRKNYNGDWKYTFKGGKV